MFCPPHRHRAQSAYVLGLLGGCVQHRAEQHLAVLRERRAQPQQHAEWVGLVVEDTVTMHVVEQAVLAGIERLLLGRSQSVGRSNSLTGSLRRTNTPRSSTRRL
jgi:hypothetical protein